MTTIQSYKELIVWQKAILLVKQIYQITEAFPESEKYGLTSQMKRCSISVPSNIAEGWGRSNQNFIHFLRISRGSLFELETQLIISEQLNFYNRCDTVSDLIIEISKMLNSLIKKLNS